MIQASNEAGPLLQICTLSSITSRSNILSNERLDEVVGNRKFFPGMFLKSFFTTWPNRASRLGLDNSAAIT